MNYYNEFDDYPAQWLRNLIAEGVIPDGEVDDRDIREVRPRDLVGYDQCHFFAGIGAWALALELAGWGRTRPCWTGSVPCQSWSVNGRRRGREDERHLWPCFFELIRRCRPPVVFGEQVSGALVVGRSDDGKRRVEGGDGPRADGAPPAWVDEVFDDLEGASYACAAFDIPAAGLGAPHVRQRLWWVADSQRHPADEGRAAGQPAEGAGEEGARARHEPGRRRDAGPWEESEPVQCVDGKQRLVEPGTFPLADGAAFELGSGGPYGGKSRARMLRAYGNAIVPQVGAEVIAAYMRSRDKNP